MTSAFWISCALMSIVLGEAAAGCYEQTDCTSCTNYAGNYYFSCKWCPLSHLCHTTGSLYNDCDLHVYVSEAEVCIPEHSEPYNHTLASQLAQWAAMSYALPRKIDPLVLTRVLDNEIPGHYRMLKVLQSQCDMMANYSACSVLVAISDVERNIIVSFEGTQNMDQLYQQMLSAALAGLEHTIVGGEVLYYNENLQNLLYPCLREYLEKILKANPSYRLTLTGHSLGGAQAQLAAATLVKQMVIPSDKVIVYTFGAPRFADIDFVGYFDRLVKTNWRLVHARDPVPRIPPSYYLYHTHGEVWFSQPGLTIDSTYVICSANEDRNCAWSQKSLCLTDECIDIHKSYFIVDLGEAFNEQRLGGPNKPGISKVGTCDSIDFNEE